MGTNMREHTLYLLLAAYVSVAAVVAADAAASCTSALNVFTRSLLQHKALHNASKTNACTVCDGCISTTRIEPSDATGNGCSGDQKASCIVWLSSLVACG
jgi:hypothetical protein